jgi:translation elongation factor P/translation initiation factor 5A
MISMGSAGDLERGNCFLYKGDVARIDKKEIISCGTHSHSKLKFYIEYIFSGKKDVITLSHQDSVETVDVMKKKATVISKSPLQIMDSQSFETMDAQADPEVLAEINEGDVVIFVDYQGIVKVLEKPRG